MKARPQHLPPVSTENAYVRLAGYEFARNYTEGKSVLDVSWEEPSYSASLLAGSAESVVGLTNSPDLPNLPHPNDSFDVVVALGILERLESPEELVSEAKRVLKPDGVLVISAQDKGVRIEGSGSREGLYAAEFRDLLERGFRNARVCRQGAVAGALTFEDGAGPEVVSLEGAHFSRTEPVPVVEFPALRYMVAACSDAGLSQEQGRPRLLLDLDHRAFEENGDLSEDVALLRDEVRRMQESETQSFQDTLALRGSENGYFRAQIRRSESRLKALETQSKAQNENSKRQIENLKRQLDEIQNSRTWRLLGLYRSLRSRVKR